MVNRQLVSFLKKSLARGHREDYLIQGLRARGWPVSEINDAFRVAKVEVGLEPSKKISEREAETALKFKKKGSEFFINILTFVGIFIVVLLLFSVFFYMNSKIKCYEESCNNPDTYSLNFVKDSLPTSIVLSLIIGAGFVVLHILVEKKNIVFWIFNILLALAVISLLISWFVFVKSV